MSQVYVGYGQFGIEGVDEEFIRFIFDVTLGSTTQYMDSEVGLVLTDNTEMQKLNLCYRGKDKTTNVLSFHNQEMEGGVQVEPDKNYLGDIFIGYEVLVKEAEDLKISEKERFVQLFIHGLLHLLGFDHEVADEATEMEDLEDKIVQLVL